MSMEAAFLELALKAIAIRESVHTLVIKNNEHYVRIVLHCKSRTEPWNRPLCQWPSYRAPVA